MEASPCSCDGSLTPFSALLPSPENGGWAENSKLLIVACSSQWPAPIQEPPSHFIKTKDTPMTQEIARVSGALCQEPGSKTKHWNKRYSKCSCPLGMNKGFRSTVSGTRSRDWYMYIYNYKSQDHSLPLHLTSRHFGPLQLPRTETQSWSKRRRNPETTKHKFPPPSQMQKRN